MQIAGKAALVVFASPCELKVITVLDVTEGRVKITVGAHSAVGPIDFDVAEYPRASADENGPPISFAVAGDGGSDDVNPIGTVRVLVARVRPSDEF